MTDTARKFYRFYIVVVDDAGGETEIEWRGLTRTKAQSMYAWTDARSPDNVKCYGWEGVC